MGENPSSRPAIRRTWRRDDSVRARNGKKENVNRGAGKRDSATVDKNDKVKGCEKVKRAKRQVP